MGCGSYILHSRISEFEKWFKNNGGYIDPRLELVIEHGDNAEVNALGYHLRVRRDLPAGQKIERGAVAISCKHEITLSALNVLASAVGNGEVRSIGAHESGGTWFPSGPSFDSAVAHAPGRCTAAVLLCLLKYQRHAECTSSLDKRPLKLSSFWDPYLSIIPALAPADGNVSEIDNVFDGPLCWSEEEREAVRNTALGKGADTLEAMWRAEWEKLAPIVNEWAFKTYNVEQDVLEWHNYLWAQSILGSRAFSSTQISELQHAHERAAGKDITPSAIGSFGPAMLLYPGIDMLNHSPSTQNEWAADAHGFAIICNDEPGPGDEVWNSYGAKNNGSLLLSYGFCERQNPHDSLQLRLPFVNQQLMQRVLAEYDESLSSEQKRHMAQLGPKLPAAVDFVHNAFFVRGPWRVEKLGAEIGYPHNLEGYPDMVPLVLFAYLQRVYEQNLPFDNFNNALAQRLSLLLVARTLSQMELGLSDVRIPDKSTGNDLRDRRLKLAKCFVTSQQDMARYASDSMKTELNRLASAKRCMSLSQLHSEIISETVLDASKLSDAGQVLAEIDSEIETAPLQIREIAGFASFIGVISLSDQKSQNKVQDYAKSLDHLSRSIATMFPADDPNSDEYKAVSLLKETFRSLHRKYPREGVFARNIWSEDAILSRVAAASLLRVPGDLLLSSKSSEAREMFWFIEGFTEKQ